MNKQNFEYYMCMFVFFFNHPTTRKIITYSSLFDYKTSRVNRPFRKVAPGT